MTTSPARSEASDQPLAVYRHPSAAAYCAGCRCTPCMDARYRYAKNYRARVAASGPAMINAAETRAHLHALLQAGYSPTAIADVAHVDRTTIVNIADGRYKTTSRLAAGRLLATSEAGILAGVPDDVRVPAIGAARRIRALQALGWTLAHMAESAELTAAALDWTVRHPDGMLPAAARRAICGVYDELSMRRGPSSRTAAYAKRAGWMPPLAWDDDEIDNAAAQPRNPANPTGQASERDGAIAYLTRLGKPAWFIADVVGCSDRTVVRARRRARTAA